jgi:hypothetical protein
MSSEGSPFADIEREWARRNAKGHVTVDSVIRAWEYFTVQVARGYPHSIYDYTNELSVRRKIAEVEAADTALPVHLADRVAASDQRFRDATIELKSPLRAAAPSEWWWFRRPVRPGEELAQDLAHEEQV